MPFLMTVAVLVVLLSAHLLYQFWMRTLGPDEQPQQADVPSSEVEPRAPLKAA